MTFDNEAGFRLPHSAGPICAENPSYKTIKDSGSDSVSGLVNSEIVGYSSSVDSAARETVVADDCVIVFNPEPQPWNERQLENTELVVFDEVSGIIHDDDLFRMVVWEWNMLPATLYNFLCKLNHDRVREEIRQVGKKKGLRSKGAYLKTRLARMAGS